jgi:hypothetical protein
MILPESPVCIFFVARPRALVATYGYLTGFHLLVLLVFAAKPSPNAIQHTSIQACARRVVWLGQRRHYPILTGAIDEQLSGRACECIAICSACTYVYPCSGEELWQLMVIYHSGVRVRAGKGGGK